MAIKDINRATGFTRGVSDVQTSVFIEQPPVDTSGAQLVKGLTGLVEGGVEAFGRAKERELADDVNTEISQFLEGGIAREDLPDAVVERALVGEQTAQTPEEASFFDDPIIQEAQAKVNKLAVAAESGAISTAALEIKVEKLIRERINKYPGYGEELRQVGARTKGDYREILGAISTAETSQASMQDYMQKQYAKDKLDHGILPSDPDGDTKYGKILQDRYLVQGIQTKHNTLDLTNKAKNADIDSNAGVITNNNFYGVIGKLKGITGQGLPQKDTIIALQNLRAQVRNDARQLYPTYDVSKLDNILAPALETIDNQIAVTNGTLDAGLAETQLKLYESSAQNDLLRDPQVRQAAAVLKFFRGDLSAIAGKAGGTELIVGITTTFSNLLTGKQVVPPPADDDSASGKTARNAYKKSGEYLSTLLGKIGKGETIAIPTEQVEQAVKSFVDFDSRKTWNNPQFDGVVSMFANADTYKTIKQTPDYATIKERVGVQMEDVLTNRLIPQMNSELVAQIGGIGVAASFGVGMEPERIVKAIHPQVSESGGIRFVFSDDGTVPSGVANVVAGLNRKYGSRLTNMARTIAHIQDSKDYTQAAGILLERIYQPLAFMPKKQAPKDTTNVINFADLPD